MRFNTCRGPGVKSAKIPNFKVQYGEMLQANLDTKTTTYFNGKIGKDLKAWGQMDLSKGKANLYTTPFKLDKNKENYIFKKIVSNYTIN